MYINRQISKELIELLNEFPAVAILGPRQVGKTTLAKKNIDLYDKPAIYLDLELTEDFNKLQYPENYLRQHNEKLIIIDEIQRKPDLFPVIRALIDENRVNGRFLFLGSASPELLKQSSETLAGRIYYKTLTPFLCSEVEDSEKHWLLGGFPNAFLARNNKAAFRWLNAFISTYIERDLPSLGIKVPSLQLRQFWEMLAHNQGQILNSSKYASNFAISPHTIKRYISILENTFLIRQLQPYAANISKRLVKSPKVYIRDSGLLHALLRIIDMEVLLGHPVVGASYEGWVIEQICSSLDTDFSQAYFYRTHAGAEIDLLISSPNGLSGFEIKRSLAPKPSRGLKEVMKDLNLKHAYIIYPGKEKYQLSENITATPLNDVLINL